MKPKSMNELFESYGPKKYQSKPNIKEAIVAETTWSIPTLEGTMTANPGDYIIKGLQGEFYPCKPDIFEASYTEVKENP